MSDVPATTIDELIERYSVLLFDAYGVLVDSTGPLPGASALIHSLEARGAPYFVVTNDASRLPAGCAARYAEFGLPIDESRVITSGTLIAPYYEEHGLEGARTTVLGTTESKRYVERAGGVLVAPDDETEVVVLADDRGFPFLETIDATITLLYRRLDAGHSTTLLLPNPDLIFPKADAAYGIAAGSIALIIEAALALRAPAEEAEKFTGLGKPHRRIFDEAIKRAGTRDVVMIGDQLATDIKGANEAGVDSALISTGLSRWQGSSAGPRPTWLLENLERR